MTCSRHSISDVISTRTWYVDVKSGKLDNVKFHLLSHLTRFKFFSFSDVCGDTWRYSSCQGANLEFRRFTRINTVGIRRSIGFYTQEDCRARGWTMTTMLSLYVLRMEASSFNDPDIMYGYSH